MERLVVAATTFISHHKVTPSTDQTGPAFWKPWRKRWKHEIVLQLVDIPKGEPANRAHIDITPNQGIDRAIEQIIALGGSVNKPPSLYLRPGSHNNEPPTIDWTVMQDQYGNEFCPISELTPGEIDAAMSVVEGDTVDILSSG